MKFILTPLFTHYISYCYDDVEVIKREAYCLYVVNIEELPVISMYVIVTSSTDIKKCFKVFILQLEGSKRWKLYSPLKELPMDPSEDLDETAMKKVRLISELTLNPGDVLYFPRGTIHQAQAVGKINCQMSINVNLAAVISFHIFCIIGEGHSTHATISTYQSHTWANYFMSTMPFLADKWTENVLSLRKGLPIHYHSKVSPKQSFFNLSCEKFVTCCGVAGESGFI